MVVVSSGEMLLWTSLRPVKNHTGKIYWCIIQCAIKYIYSYSYDNVEMGLLGGDTVQGRCGGYSRNDLNIILHHKYS